MSNQKNKPKALASASKPVNAKALVSVKPSSPLVAEPKGNISPFNSAPGVDIRPTNGDSSSTPKLPDLNAPGAFTFGENSEIEEDPRYKNVPPPGLRDQDKHWGVSAMETIKDSAPALLTALQQARAEGGSPMFEGNNINPIRLVWNFGKFIGRTLRKKNVEETVDEMLDPSRGELRDGYVGLTGVFAVIVSFIYTHLTWTPIAKFAKWTGLKWFLSLFGPVISFINQYFTPAGERIFKEILQVDFVNGSVKIVIGKGLWILASATGLVLFYAGLLISLFWVAQQIFEISDNLIDESKARRNARPYQSPKQLTSRREDVIDLPKR